jgi:hypothetical protein
MGRQKRPVDDRSWRLTGCEAKVGLSPLRVGSGIPFSGTERQVLTTR